MEITKFVVTLIMIILVMGALFVLIFLFFETGREIEIREIERASIEIAETLLSSELTTSYGVLDKAKLDAINGQRVQPFEQHCAYIYNITVDGFEQFRNEETGVIEWRSKSWRTNYIPDYKLFEENWKGEFLNEEVLFVLFKTGSYETQRSYPVHINYGNIVLPAQMTIYVKKDFMNDIACTIKTAFASGKAERTGIPFSVSFSFELKEFDKNTDDNRLCFEKKDNTDINGIYCIPLPKDIGISETLNIEMQKGERYNITAQKQGNDIVLGLEGKTVAAGAAGG